MRSITLTTADEIIKIDHFNAALPKIPLIQTASLYATIKLTSCRWDYKNKYYYDAINHLIHLKDMEKIKNIGLTNFDTDHLADLIEEGAPIVSNQVIQCNLLDCF